jgi:LCP family protein required for cell wall assembly
MAAPAGRVSGRATIPTMTPGGRGAYGPDGDPVGAPAGPSGRPPGSGRGTPYRSRRRPRWGRIALVVGLALALVLGGLALFTFQYAHHLDAQVARTDPFSRITEPRPDKLVSGAMNVLILGSDSRNPDSTANSRTDTMILMHVQADHKHAYLISIPRDSYVYIPKSPTNPNEGDAHSKINSAFAWGGPTLAVETVEKLTNVRVDHLVMIDFGGFQQVTDALGGVDMYVDKTITSIHPPHRVFRKGMNHFTGAQALDYVRQRYQFADGDITREKHQQEFMKAIMDKAVSTGTITNPGRLNAFLQSVTKAVTVDKDLSLIDTMLQFRNLRSSDLTFMTTPFSGFGRRNGESVVLLDEAKDAALFGAVAKDTMAQYMSASKGG